MELDAQVAEPLQLSGTNLEQKHKHKKKDKHKHKHHKKSKKDRHGDPEQKQAREGSPIAEGEVARTGSEDGELPGPPAVQEYAAAFNEAEGRNAQDPANSLPAGLQQFETLSPGRASAKRRYFCNAEMSLLPLLLDDCC